jgi:predicted DNA-binding transcriptional regulator AlpA
MQPRASPSEPLVVSVDEGRRMAGIGRTKFYELINEGRVKTVTIGRRRLVFVASIREMLEGR